MDVDKLAQNVINSGITDDRLNFLARAVLDRGERIKRLEAENIALREQSLSTLGELEKATEDVVQLREAMGVACDYIEIVVGACPFDAVPDYVCPHEQECTDHPAKCWVEYFMVRKGLEEGEGANEPA